MLSWAVGVGNNEEAFSEVRRAKGRSRKSKRPDGVAQGFQVIGHRIQIGIDEASNILSKHPTRSELRNNAAHFRPDVAIISRAASLSRQAEWLARESSDHNVSCWKVVYADFMDISPLRHVWPMFAQYGLCVVVNLHLGHTTPSRALQAEVKTTYSGEETDERKHKPSDS